MPSLSFGLATVALLAACLTSALPHLETVFSITMPYAQTTFGGNPSDTAPAFLFQDAVYVIASGQNTIEAVNLTTKQVMWVAANISSQGYVIFDVAITSEAVLISFQSGITALSPSTGAQMWTAEGYQLAESGAAYSFGGWIYARGTLPPDDAGSQFYVLQSFNAATGAPGPFTFSNALLIDGTTAFFNSYNIIQEGEIVNDVLTAVDITTNTTLWSIPYNVQGTGFIEAIDKTRIFFGNYSGGDEVGTVLDRKTGAVLNQFQGFNGVGANSQTSPAAFDGNYLFALIGESFPRYVLIDLTTGFIIWTRGLDDVGPGARLVNGAVVAVSPALVLSITPITGGGNTISVPHVPTLPTASISAFGGGLLEVGNLEGYTLWDSATGTPLGRNEQSPGATGGNAMVWNGITVTVTENVVVGSKVVP